MARDIVRYGPVAPSMALVHPSYCLQCIAPWPTPPPLDSPLHLNPGKHSKHSITPPYPTVTPSHGHVLRMPKHHLPRQVLFSVPPSGWRKSRGGQHMTWQKGVKEITKSLGAVGVVRLPGLGSRDPVCAWLETLQEMAANRRQWRSCCQFLSRMSD
ncbi:hypothetical protein T265_10468 [Opisthorchis viverrini]|uniref:Uncharacterized protein n=1 Tax=Opisthorchis viverrini TaxID=6198 RepID=A0A074Z258_OPIVI|nr:hypothetical protein T265_10468 [Opisthorchis viverrini]KER21136.1 hypothetical protein T265_10468 [Opisthorchis viverrini]